MHAEFNSAVHHAIRLSSKKPILILAACQKQGVLWDTAYLPTAMEWVPNINNSTLASLMAETNSLACLYYYAGFAQS